MQSLVRRLKYYGIGFGIGTIFVIFFFSNRGCSWLPENRVKNTILDRLIVVPEETASVLEQKGLTREDVINVLNDGDVEFSKSDKDGESKKYLLEKDGVSYVFTLPYESCISEVYVTSSVKKVKPLEEGLGEIVHFPKDDNLVHVDTNTRVTCQQDKLGLISETKIFDLIKESGKIDFSKTKLEVRPKPEHHLVFKLDEEEIGVTVTWYKNKLNITTFHHSSLGDCTK